MINLPNKEDDLAFELANDNLFQRGIIGPFNHVAYRTTMANLDVALQTMLQQGNIDSQTFQKELPLILLINLFLLLP